MTVVFPLPFGPRKPKISPRFTSKLTSFTAVNFPNVRTRCSAEIATSVGGMDFPAAIAQLAAFSFTSAAMPARTRFDGSSMRTFTPNT